MVWVVVLCECVRAGLRGFVMFGGSHFHFVSAGVGLFCELRGLMLLVRRLLVSLVGGYVVVICCCL